MSSFAGPSHSIIKSSRSTSRVFVLAKMDDSMLKQSLRIAFVWSWLVGWVFTSQPLETTSLRYFVENMSPLGDSPYQVTLWKVVGDLQLLVGDKKVHKESPGPRIFAFLFWIQYFVPKKWRVAIIVIQLLFKGQKHVAPFIYDGRLAPSAEWREFVWFVGGNPVWTKFFESRNWRHRKQQFATQVLGDFFHENKRLLFCICSLVSFCCHSFGYHDLLNY